jgi:hypothetical protein
MLSRSVRSSSASGVSGAAGPRRCLPGVRRLRALARDRALLRRARGVLLAGDVAIDGRDGEWLGELSYVPDLNLGVAARNDASHVYLCLVTRNRRLQAQVLRRGLTLWIDPGGAAHKRIGIHYPIDRRRVAELREQASEPDEDGDEAPSPAGRLVFEPGEHPSFELLREGIASEPAKLVYELKLPLADGAGSALAIGASPGAWIGIGLQTAAFEIKKKDPFPVPVGRPQRRGPGASSPGWPGGNLRAAADPSRPQPFEIWARLRLAAPPGAQP